TLCNYVTPAVVRAIEWVSALYPKLPHLYLASSRDEAFDKAVRLFRWHRKGARIVVGLEGAYVGHTSAAARSLSDPSVHRQGPSYFEGWLRVPHPSDAESATLKDLEKAVEGAGGAQNVIGLFLESVQERTGKVIPPDFWSKLESFREASGIPVCLIETASACYRSSRGPFFSRPMEFVPDMMAWWGGGQVGFLHVKDSYFVTIPLTFVSTWDGDELSLIRIHHQLREARNANVLMKSEALQKALAASEICGVNVRGAGLYQVIEF